MKNAGHGSLLAAVFSVLFVSLMQEFHARNILSAENMVYSV